VRRALFAAVVLGLAASVFAGEGGKKAAPAPAIDESLPVLGTQLAELPSGPGKITADAACLKCHSADILRQQRLNEKQWTANVTKMVGWGVDVPEDKRAELIAYLVKNFGPDNDRFKPVVTRPAGR
jgi:hypothetical protein